MGLSENEENTESYKTVIESGLAALSLRSPSSSVQREDDRNDNKNSELYNEHEIIKFIGEGSYGRVVEARIKKSGKTCAIKIIKIGEETSEREAENEASIHRGLIHENIVRYDYSWMSDGSFYIRMEYCQNGTLRSAIEDGMYSRRYWMLANQLLKVINYLHHQGIAHCDLKSDNILIDREGRLKLIDFGIAERLEATKYSKELETLVYSGYPADLVKRDIEGFGEILFEMRYGPFDDEDDLAESKNLFLQESDISSSSDDIEDGFPTQEEVIRTVLNKDLEKLPKPEKLDSEDQLFGFSMDWFPKLIAQATGLILALTLIFVFVWVCIVVMFHMPSEETIQYKAAYWELYKLASRVTWQI